jgi:hypothetical protein
VHLVGKCAAQARIRACGRFVERQNGERALAPTVLGGRGVWASGARGLQLQGLLDVPGRLLLDLGVAARIAVCKAGVALLLLLLRLL